MATHTDAPPPYTPGTPEFTENAATKIEQVEAAHRTMRLQRYLLEIIAYFLPVDMPKLVEAIPFEWPTYNGFRASLLQKKERAHLLHLSQTHTKHVPNKHTLNTTSTHVTICLHARERTNTNSTF